jgi:hypothetical protein
VLDDEIRKGSTVLELLDRFASEPEFADARLAPPARSGGGNAAW